MKTIFITSFHQLISRNILSTPLLKLLLQKGDIRVVLLVPDDKKDFFQKEFGRTGVLVEGVPRALTRRDIFLRYLALSAVDTKALEVIRKAEFDALSSWLLRMVGRKRLGQRAIRAADRFLTPRGRFAKFFDQYRPALVFSTDMQNENDVRLMHEAKDRKVPVVAMVRSWDNFTTKGILRVLPRILVVPNEIVKREAETLSFVPEDRIVPVGIPHYDRYLDIKFKIQNPKSKISYNTGDVLSREEFCLKFGLDPAKKIILFSPIGNRFIRNNLLDKLVLETLSLLDANILVRLPPSDYVTLDGFKTKKAHVVFDTPGTGPTKDRKLNELSQGDDARLIAELAHCDVVVTGQSTIAVDASMFNKPVVIIYFDEVERSYWESVKRYYDSEYYRPVAESGGVRFAKNPEELNSLVGQYLENSRLDEEGRARIAREQAYKIDGKATERLAQVLLISLRTV